ncbi:MAG: drug/metabolite exporter YedA [Anaerolineae bacterium]|nr:drug/metabolite exporter YedA [Anaerolineae bacterium]
MNRTSPPTWQLVAAFAAVYIIWGSTYLAISYAIETLPPFLMAGGRFLFAGLLLFIWSRARGAAAPRRIHWRSTLIIGSLLLMGGNGGVTWAEQRVPSGLAALMVAIVPLWVVLLDWLRPGGTRPGLPVFAGLLVGLAGIALLVAAPGASDVPAGETGGALDLLGLGALLLATFCWANGSLYSRSAPLPNSPLLTTGMEMIGGGAVLILAGTLTGEWARLDLSQVSTNSLLALIYLVIFGSIVAFTAYIWLLKVTTPARAATYAYVNPVVAVFLGWVFRGEELTPRTLIAAAIIIGAVVIITLYRQPAPQPKAEPLPAEPQPEPT